MHEGMTPEDAARALVAAMRDPYNREGWGAGPWDDEQDRYEWTDEATGLPCLAVRNRLGSLCGYVGVAPDHPYYGRETDSRDVEHLEAHGGINYAAPCQEDEGGGHGDICHSTPGDPRWWFGFDCSHFQDVTPAFNMRERLMDAIHREALFTPPADWQTYKTIGYVRAECASLAAQLVAVAAVNDGRWHAPFTDEQVAAIQAWQDSGRVPYTCLHHSTTSLAVTRDGLVCPQSHCDYAQAWAHDHGGTP